MCAEGNAQQAPHGLHISPSSFLRGTKGGGKNIPQRLHVVLCLGKIVCTPIRCTVRACREPQPGVIAHLALVELGKESELKALYWEGKKKSRLVSSHCNGIVSWSHKDWQHPQSSQNTGRKRSFRGAGMLHRQFLAIQLGKDSRRRGEPPWILNQELDITLQAASWGCHFYFILLVSSSQKLKLLCLVGVLLQNE